MVQQTWVASSPSDPTCWRWTGPWASCPPEKLNAAPEPPRESWEPEWGEGGVHGVEEIILAAQPSRQSGAHSSLFTPTLLTSHFTYTQKAGAKLRHHPWIHYLLYGSSFVLILHLISSGLVDQHAHSSLGSCKRVCSRTDRSGWSRALLLKSSRVETQQTRLWTT